jgi:hypothetical protein
MTALAGRGRRSPGRVLKSPLAVPGTSAAACATEYESHPPAAGYAIS